MELLGVAASPGLALGRALVVERQSRAAMRLTLEPHQTASEAQRLRQAVQASHRQLERIRERLAREGARPDAYMFDAQLLMLDDPLLLDRALTLVERQRVNAEWALRVVSEDLHALFDDFADEYLRERRSDLDDVLGRIALNLSGADDAPSLARLPGDFVLVAEELEASQAAELDWPRVRALVIAGGSRTSHTVILARSRGVPAVVAVADATRRIAPGALIAVDGTRGLVAVEPSAPALDSLRAAQERDRREAQQLDELRPLAAETCDGVRLCLRANIELVAEAAAAHRAGAEGIGLFRSEYLLGTHGRWPGEEQQLESYRRLLEAMHPHPVVLRTWDVGPEEVAPLGASSPNQAMGERALRLLARHPEPFRVQVRAALRAAVHGPLALMLPFVAGAADLRAALKVIEEARASLRRDGLPFAERVPVGLNIEIPAAALAADLLAPQVDFLAIGTNDLVQYLLAVDRSDPRVAHLYQPLHPAVLRTLRQVVRAGQACQVPVSACGELAGEPLGVVALVGLGLRELSLAPPALPRVKAVLRGLHAGRAARAVEECLHLAGAEEVEERLGRELARAQAAAGRD